MQATRRTFVERAAREAREPSQPAPDAGVQDERE
jgi:hypothetical protein